MSTIYLSSSPPRTFARSPTPVHSSSPGLPSPTAILRGEIDTCKRFKAAPISRNGFSGGFVSPKLFLCTKKGAENVPIRSPGRDRFKPASLVQPKKTITSETKTGMQYDLKVTATKSSHAPADPRTYCCGRPDAKFADDAETALGKSQRPFEGTSDNPLNLVVATPRRLDWTPVREQNRLQEASGLAFVDAPTVFPDGLMDSFGYTTDDTKEVLVKGAEPGNPTKRRKVDIVKATLPPQKAEKKTTSKTSTARRTKPSTKKALTITRLATSYYQDTTEKPKTTPMMEFLSATQARATEIEEGGLIDKLTEKLPVRKPKVTKPKPQKPQLLSPQSALEIFEQQEALFGSASQLAREESPTLLRDTLEAMRRSETNLLSDPISTQPTQPTSLESTTPQPVRGTSRFVKTRNLWAAAGRDEDNALLHVDSVDLSDTPTVRLAFAGKDVLVQPGIRPRFPQTPSLLLRSGHCPLSRGSIGTPYDVDDLVTPIARARPTNPQISVARPYHSSTMENGPVSAGVVAAAEVGNQQQIQGDDNLKQSKSLSTRMPKKPSYAGLSVHELQKQISAYGFKPVKKREKMIELLDRCWEEKYNQEALNKADATESLKHGDFLSKVHDVSARPQPKVKKPRKSASATKEDGIPGKEPKRRRKADPKPKEAKTLTKTPRKRKPKATPLPETAIVDIDDGEGSQIAKDVGGRESGRPLTPPLTEPALATVEDLRNRDSCTSETIPITTEFGEQIQAAILHESQFADRERDHVSDPTWHEKILLYDPIILEDLTIWLNTEGLDKIGEDREVGALEVRAWCESNGICCLWKGGWRGQKVKNVED